MESITTTPRPPEMDAAVAALRGLRFSRVGLLEAQLVDLLEAALERAGLSPSREVALAPGCRIDLALPAASGLLIGIEAKRGRPGVAAAAAQVTRYARTGRLGGLVFVAERAFDLPSTLGGVPVSAVSLQASFGIAL